MSKKRYKNKRVNLAEANVNITSLLDVLTVLLFFLIQSFTVNNVSSLPEGIRLPASIIENEIEETVVVALSKDKLYADNKVIITFKNGKFSAQDIGEDNRTLIPLQKYLTKQLKKKYALVQGVGRDLSKLPPGKVTIQADRELPFSLMKYMLHTVATSGYSDYQFVVNAKD